MTKTSNQELLVAAIKDGTVIDHIPSSRIFEVVGLLGLQGLGSAVVVGCNLESGQMGKKSIIKVADKFFSPEEVDRLSVVAPGATLSIIRDYNVVEKHQVKLPAVLRGIVRCDNPVCVTNNEPMPSRFHVVSPSKVRCHYCEHEQELSKVQIQG
ncbi:MAG: aspartate carbamoyltransferase regulatory subunit [Bacteroidaceae bacterium]|nr:aspartate carbamoyltransferase regulatory subunit [Bacteroidaceae bacterium]